MANTGRLAREDWIALARRTLVTSGVEDVKVDVLARRLKVTRGSFYHHFANHKELLGALLEDWEANNRREIAAVGERMREAGGGLIELFRIWLGEDPAFPAFDIAIRVWARKSEDISGRVRIVDEAWIALFQDYLERGGMTAPESFVRARIMYFHQVGYFALAIREDLDVRARLAPYYHLALVGSPAPPGMVEALLAIGDKKAGGKKAPARRPRQVS